MLDDGLGSSDLQTVSLEVPPMSKAERLHRWADGLELQKQLRQDAALAAGDGWCSTSVDRSPLAVAFEDWAFQAEGLRSDQVEDALAFFDLSETEIQRVIGPFYDARTIPTAVAAKRVRALARQAEAATAPQVGEPVSAGSVALSVRRSVRSSTAADRRRARGTAGAAPRGGEAVRRVRGAGAPSRPPARDYAPPSAW
ncbi:MAG TPA: hypothetical protein VLE23_12325 [Geminicoccaceae bacterium]|nr:hypothetical protein [Geminicoccaceae bacterium]